jgi:hypothetical protein
MTSRLSTAAPINPYEAPAHSDGIAAGKALVREQALALGASIYSALALAICFGITALAILTMSERFSYFTTSGKVIGICVIAIFPSGCVANVCSLFYVSKSLRLFCVVVAIVNAAILLRTLITAIGP